MHVTDLSFGCSGIGNLYHDIPKAEAAEVMARAWDAGIRYFDTAPHYGRGLSEQRLGAFLKGRARDSFVISTKVGRLLSSGKPMAEANGFINPLPNDVRYDYSGHGIEASFEQSCERLGTSYIDIIYVHDIGAYTHGDGNAPHFEALMSSGLDRLQKLKAAGRIGAFGLGVNETKVCLDVMQECPLDVILLAGRLTLLDRQGEDELVGRCRNAQTSMVLGGIFNSGILATGPVQRAHFDYQPATDEIMEQVAQLQARTDHIGVPLATVAMQYARRHPAAASVLLGTGKVSSLKRNLNALDVPWDSKYDWVFDPV